MKRFWRRLALVVLAGYVLGMVWVMRKPLPAGVSLEGKEYQVPAESVKFLADRTYVDQQGKRQSDQEIFDEVMRLVAEAEKYILLDMFLYNDFQGVPPETTRVLAGELTEALAVKKRDNPEIAVTVVSDPLNTVYGGALSPHFERLKEAGVTVVLTDLSKLRDSNPAYAAGWRALGQWWGNTTTPGLMPHPFVADGQKVTVRSWLALLNFKANHRKLIVADVPQPGGGHKIATLVTSANPHDGSSAHGNIAIKVEDQLWQDAILSEQAVGSFSGAEISGFVDKVADEDGKVTTQLLTEGAIFEKMVALTERAKAGDTIDMAMFYLSERSIIKALGRAAERGAAVRILLDPNKDAFGRTKNGVPNRPVAHELGKKLSGKIQIRWCETHGEQCHSKLVLMTLGGEQVMLAGSANFTRRNLGDYNLETNVLVRADGEIPAMDAARKYFEEMWQNEGGKVYSAEYGRYAEASLVKTIMYRIQEATGLSSF